MRADWALVDVIGYVQTWSAARALERAEGRAPFQAWCRDLARVWGAPARVRPVHWPLSLRVGRVPSTPEGTRA